MRGCFVAVLQWQGVFEGSGGRSRWGLHQQRGKVVQRSFLGGEAGAGYPTVEA